VSDPASGGTGERVLRRSREDRVLGGVCGGLSRYLGVDPVVVRLGFVILAVAGGGGIILYLLAWLIIPEEEEGDRVGPPPEGRSEGVWLWAGVALIALGSILLVDRLLPWFDRVVGPLVLVAIGAGILLHGLRR
jgi:phage shock protein C